VIVIVSHAADAHTARVLDELARLEREAELIDTAEFPSRARLRHRFEGGVQRPELTVGGRRVDLARAGVGWWRRPQPFTLEDGVAPEAVSFAYTECHEAVAGLWGALPIPWVNPPHLDEAAHHKPYQLAVAARVGLRVPRTLITNDPDAARDFIAEVGTARTVYKTFLATADNWRETRTVDPVELDLLDQVRLAPIIFQEYVLASADIRVTVVGPSLFPAAIVPAPGGYALDYRMDLEGACFRATDLPSATEARIRSLVEHLGLVYGAIDLRRTPDGDHVFLEINPAGEWLFVEERTGQPITRSFASLLAKLDATGLAFKEQLSGGPRGTAKGARQDPAPVGGIARRAGGGGRSSRGCFQSGRPLDRGRPAAPEIGFPPPR